MEVADRAVVLRQGRYIGEAVPDQEHHEELVSMIVGGRDSDRSGGEDPAGEKAQSGQGDH
jgi:ABC-type sugar transport system ATPase subunit